MFNVVIATVHNPSCILCDGKFCLFLLILHFLFLSNNLNVIDGAVCQILL